jgi:hypothetical protein
MVLARISVMDTRAAGLAVRRLGIHRDVQAFVAVFLVLGLVVGVSLFGWAAFWSVRRHGFRATIRGAARTYFEELPLYWRAPVVAWTFLIALPLIAAWATFKGDWDPVGAIFLALLWLLYLALLLWHRRARARTRAGRDHPHRDTRSV